MIFLTGILPCLITVKPTLALEEKVTLVGRIQKVSEKSLRLETVKLLRDRSWMELGKTVYCQRDPKQLYKEGDWIGLNGQVKSTQPIVFISVFLPREAFHYRYSDSFFEPLIRAGTDIASSYTAHIQEVLSDREAMIASGIFIGKGITGELQDILNNSGLGHLFVVSGMHFFILFQVIWLLLSFCNVNSRFRIIFSAVFLLFFLLVTGFTPSSCRAFVFILLLLFFRVIGYPAGTLNLLGATAIILLLGSPSYATDIGFQLSFLATLGIFTGNRYATLTARKSLKYLLPVTGAAVFTTPLVIQEFGRMPFVSLAFNLFFVSYMSTFLLIGMLLSFFFFLSSLQEVSRIFLFGLKPVLWANDQILTFLGTNFIGTIPIPKEFAIIFWILPFLFFIAALREKPTEAIQ